VDKVEMRETWEQAKEILALALEQSAEERIAFVRKACGGDAALLAEVESLLVNYDGADSLLENSPAANLFSFHPVVMTGKRVGAYRIIREIGHGGMAVVYLGERDDQNYRKQIAIKMVKPGIDTEQVLHRFRNERQTLAALDHSNIVKLLDGGSSDDGSPYLVMEYVEGLPIDQYCDLNQLSIDDRLRLFRQVCSAVQYAHDKLVIHRDLKPANILIAKGGVPRLLDFGIAKLLNPECFQTPLVTRTDWRPMTPEYASPEQIRGRAITTATDVYSLGVLLFELLTGHRPYRATGQSLLEMERLVCEDQPERPSAVIYRKETASRDGDPPTAITPESVSHQRGLQPAELQRRLRGDLDTIVMKALRKESERRYVSVEEFSLDVERYLTGMPVRARKSTIAYRSGRFLHRHKESLAAVLVVLGLVATVAGVGYFFFHHPNPKLTDKDTVVLADFTNTTGDAVFDDALKQALAVELGQSPFLNVLSDRRVSETLRMMGRPANERVTVDVGRELCLRAGSKAILSGSISSLGGSYVIGLVAVGCETGEVLDREQVQASGRPDVLKALDQAASTLRAKLGESLPSVQKFEVPIEATTTSLEALKDYSMGVKVTREQGDAPGIPFLKRALELDPNFPMAYAGLSIRYGNLNQPSLALEYAARAYELRDRGTEREKLRISSTYFRATGETEKEVQTYQLWIANYPRDHAAHGNLGIDYGFMGQYEQALAQSQEALQLEPHELLNYANLGALYLNLNRLEEAQAVFDQALARKLDGGPLRWMLYYLAFLRGDSARMEQQLTWAVGKPGDEDTLLSFQSDTEAYYGRLSKARALTRQAVDSAVRSGSPEAAALWQVNAALRGAEFGQTVEAKQRVADALALAPGRDVNVLAALALARIGETARAKRLVEKLEKNYPSNTMLKSYWLPTVNAAIELREGDSSQALALLEAAAPYELGWPPPLQPGTLYPAYLRGQAYLLAHDGVAATAEFQKLLDHRGIVANFPTGALARLGYARACVLQGNTANARIAYQDFLSLWKNADPDVPILKQAKAEYAKLQ
jgi:serine/threonine protein kinase/tetratricopeptide (TPR) repeat protein